MSDRILQQRINIKFCVKLGRRWNWCIVHFELIPQGQTVKQDYYVEILKRMHVAVHRKIKGLNFGPTTEFSTVTVLQPIRRSLSSSFWSKIDYWNGTPPPRSPDLAPNDLWLFPKYKVCLEDKRMWRWHWKLFHKRSSKNICNNGRQHSWVKCIAAQEE